MSKKNTILDKKLIDSLLSKYNSDETVDFLEENNISNTVLSLSKIKLSEFINKQFYPIDTLYEDEIDIKENGIVAPLLITKKENSSDYVLINGVKRYLILKHIDSETAPVAIIGKVQNKSIDEYTLLNIIKNNDSPIITAYALNKYQQKYKLTTEELSYLTNISYSQILNLIRLLSLPKKYITALVENKISYTKLRPLLTLNDENRDRLFDEILKTKLSTREIEEKIREAKMPNKDKYSIKQEGNKIIISCKTYKDSKELFKKLNKEFTKKSG